jgi:hypothetical protein
MTDPVQNPASKVSPGAEGAAVPPLRCSPAAQEELAQSRLDDIREYVRRATITVGAIGLVITDAWVSKCVTHEAPAEGWVLSLRVPEATTAERIHLMEILEDSYEIDVIAVVTD